jgi:hypothetical protein
MSSVCGCGPRPESSLVPGGLQRQPVEGVEGAFEELQITFTSLRLLRLVKEDCGPSMHRIHFAEVPLLIRHLQYPALLNTILGMSSAKLDSLCRALMLCANLLLASALRAQEGCGVQVKLLLSPMETQTAIASLNVGNETAARVYFFDTRSLDLLSQGVIVRLRQGSANDFTVKLRPPDGRRLQDPSGGRENFECEVDLNGGRATLSYLIQSRYAAEWVPETGNDISRLLSAGQEKLLQEAQVSIDWSRVKRIADIKSTDWQTKAQPPFKTLTLELWEWPAGKILELSTKVGPDDGPLAYRELEQLVKGKGLSLSGSQRLKTTMVLEALTHAAAH